MTSITEPQPIKPVQNRLPVKQRQPAAFSDRPAPPPSDNWKKQKKEKPGARLDLCAGVACACGLELDVISTSTCYAGTCVRGHECWSQCKWFTSKPRQGCVILRSISRGHEKRARRGVSLDPATACTCPGENQLPAVQRTWTLRVKWMALLRDLFL